MPRKNNPKPQRRGGPRRARPDRSPIDWEAAEAANRGEDPDQTRAPKRRSIGRPQRDRLHNEFVRKLTGFSDSALDIIMRYGFENADETGAIPVMFTGISKRPTAEIGYDKPGLVVSRGGLVVVSSVIARQDRGEVGIGEGIGIRRAGSEPPLDSHNSAHRFNIALGRQPQGVKEHELASELLDGSTLVLSPVTEVNGHAIEPGAEKWEVNKHWEMWDEPPSYGLRAGGYDSQWDGPGPLGGGYW